MIYGQAIPDPTNTLVTLLGFDPLYREMHISIHVGYSKYMNEESQRPENQSSLFQWWGYQFRLFRICSLSTYQVAKYVVNGVMEDMNANNTEGNMLVFMAMSICQAGH